MLTREDFYLESELGSLDGGNIATRPTADHNQVVFAISGEHSCGHACVKDSVSNLSLSLT